MSCSAYEAVNISEIMEYLLFRVAEVDIQPYDAAFSPRKDVVDHLAVNLTFFNIAAFVEQTFLVLLDPG